MRLKDYKFENLSPSNQLIVFIVLMLALAGAFYGLYLKDSIAKRDTLQSEVTKLQKSVAEATAVERKLKQFKEDLALLEMRLTVMRSILPAQKETPMVLRSVQDMASASNLKITKFNPQPVVPHAFYLDWPIRLEVEGSYDALGHFFEKIGQFTRIINVENINIKGIDGSVDSARTLNAACSATTFVFREDQVAEAPK